MSFRNELIAQVNNVRNEIKTHAINLFINKLKDAMKYTASLGITNGSISLRLNFEDHYEDDYEDDMGELDSLNELLLITKEREPGATEMYKWLIKEIDKTDIFKDIYITLDDYTYELKYFWDLEDE